MFVRTVRQAWAALVDRASTAPIRRRAPRRAPRLVLEALEDRLTPSTLTVSNNPNDHDMFTTIQAAVNAANPGDTIRVDPGTYTEQITIGAGKNNLTLTTNGHPDAIIVAPATLTGKDALVLVSGAKHVTLNDFFLQGNTQTQFGVRVEKGASATISNNRIANIAGSNGAGIVIGESLTSAAATPGDVASTGSGIVIGNTVYGYTQAGIVVDNAGSNAAIACNTVTGRGVNGSGVVQEGVQVSYGANAAIANNTISANANVVDGFDSEGILVISAGNSTTVQANHVFQNDLGILIDLTNNVQVAQNVCTSNSNDGIQLLDASRTTVLFNVCAYNGGDGISVYGTAATSTTPATGTNNVIAFNVIFDNDGSGVRLDTTTGDTVAFNFIDHDDGTAAITITNSANNQVFCNLIIG